MVSLLLVTGGAVAQPTPAQEQLNRALMQRCPEFINHVSTFPELRPILTVRALNVKSVCECTTSEFAKDARIQSIFSRDLTEVATVMRTDKFKSYAVGRLIASVFACMAPELDASILASDPE
jgi:hypothetical protein